MHQLKIYALEIQRKFKQNAKGCKAVEGIWEENLRQKQNKFQKNEEEDMKECKVMQ